ncbi:GNAT family N-acetyltransferase [Dermatophilaceae bacterium Soc4.6]
MSPTTVILVEPSTERQQEWLELVAEFDGGHVDGGGFFGVTAAELADPHAFAQWVETLRAQERGEQVPDGFVASTLRWVETEGRLVGTVSLRHELNPFLLQVGGHIGYAVRPTARRRGVATAALAAMLEVARARGLERALVTCDDDNVGSARTIEGNGGVLEDVRDDKRRYWIALT